MAIPTHVKVRHLCCKKHAGDRVVWHEDAIIGVQLQLQELLQ